MSRPVSQKLLLSAATILTLVGGGALISTQVAFPTEAFSQTGSEAPAMPVPYITVEQKPVEIWKEFSARLAAVDFVEIRPQVSGLINKVHFTDGQIVNKGDVLYTIDPRPYAAAVAQAKADLAAANSEVVYAKKELERAEELIKTGALSKQVYDQRMNATKVANNTVAAAAARVKSAQVDLDNASIKAPINGRISRTEITEGNLVSAAAAPLLTTIVSDKDIHADFEIDEKTYLQFVRGKAGQSVESEQGVPIRMKINADDKWYEGKITSFDNRINPSSGTIRARALFTNDDNALLPGMFTKVQIGSPSEESVIAIPEKAIATDQSRKYVLVVGEGNVAEYRQITPGETVGTNRIITSGLEIGDRVIVDNLMKVRPGAKITPMTQAELDAMKAKMAGGGAPASAPAPDAPATETAPEAPAQEEAPVTEAPSAEPTAETIATDAPTTELDAPEEQTNSELPILQLDQDTAPAQE
jgi:multidrug efflux system membrane fusion protein